MEKITGPLSAGSLWLASQKTHATITEHLININLGSFTPEKHWSLSFLMIPDPTPKSSACIILPSTTLFVVDHRPSLTLLLQELALRTIFLLTAQEYEQKTCIQTLAPIGWCCPSKKFMRCRSSFFPLSSNKAGFKSPFLKR